MLLITSLIIFIVLWSVVNAAQCRNVCQKLHVKEFDEQDGHGDDGSTLKFHLFGLETYKKICLKNSVDTQENCLNTR